MTTHYIDIQVISDPETSAPHIMGALFEKFHLALVRDRIDSIGISFPEYSVTPKTLGTVLRLHGEATALQQLQQADWLKGVRDYVRIKAIAEAPEDAPHRAIQRKQFKTNVERLRRRRMRRTGESEQSVKELISEDVEQRPTLPYVKMHSRSTGQSFCLYIAMGSTQPDPVSGTFNTYGLSTCATVPWF
ncbi:type I-F CRISPR-associated endoribonuclease Cas6/Csy4 [Cephaloticoccus primus]|uniref:Type I-F CRISPR-associated endoribonuclease Cas6/Csy4 n=1 Tax=Cephaloticoccus primus TaxID=1548207 RepID=A0A139SI32_9BACT|nr:type I-F CRISPR-associated endoribonuclease Cas6/Csy4 [Cephaloticoccus primus]KXU34207.1 type I-F CRISPR-associated endoribonuclease Cas6/Csy4 [Cephaloticoccus primus]